MSLFVVPTAAVIFLVGLWFFRGRRRSKVRHEIPETRSVYCKKCGGRIGVLSVSTVQHEFSLKCTTCQTRKFYSLADLTR
jgi:hypothetical protein